MVMSAATLASNFDAMALASTEAAAITAWAQAYTDYVAQARCGAVNVNVLAINAAPKSALAAALVGMSASGAGAAKMQAGLVAFWAAIVGTRAICFPGASFATPPPGTAGLAAALASTFAANAAPGVTKTAALASIASVFHAASSGGTCTFGVPTFPIL